MSAISTSEIWEKLKDKEYREGYSLAHTNVDFCVQIMALAARRRLTLDDVVEQAGVPVEEVDGDRAPTLKTLHRLADLFDVGLMVKFAPFSELVTWEHTFDAETFDVPSFEGDKLASESSDLASWAMMAIGYSVPPVHANVFRSTSSVSSHLFYRERKVMPQPGEIRRTRTSLWGPEREEIEYGTAQR